MAVSKKSVNNVLVIGVNQTKDSLYSVSLFITREFIHKLSFAALISNNYSNYTSGLVAAFVTSPISSRPNRGSITFVSTHMLYFTLGSAIS